MKKFILPTVVLLALVAFGFFIYLNKQPALPGDTSEMGTEELSSSTPRSSTKYTSYAYRYIFEYVGAPVMITDEDPAYVLVSGPDGGPWIFNITAIVNATSSLDDIAKSVASEWAATADLNESRKVSITNAKIAGQPAKYVSISGLGDYGNAFAVVANGKNVLVIKGDDSTPVNKRKFLDLLKSFTFSVSRPPKPAM